MEITDKKKLPIVVFLMGTTASGKSELAIQLSNLFPCDIISVDSALIYRGMNIGTDKPDSKTLLSYPHKLINIRDPIDIYTIENFRQDALREIERSIFFRHRIPILIGGTMLYYKVLLHGLSSLPISNYSLKRDSNAKLNSLYSYEYLKSIDPISASRIHKNDKKRIFRAIEVFLKSKKTLSNLYSNVIPYNFPYTVLQFFLYPFNKSLLYYRIESRFKKMLDQGFELEFEKLFFRGDLNSNLPSMKCIGYRQMWKYFLKEITYDEMINSSIISTKRLVKKQITWSKKWKDLFFLNSGDFLNSLNFIQKTISRIIKK
ncbi:tRNA dimethylallyltransferase [Buchnera aphidicola (Tetraneura ulmi)]|uniref:tRNA (adenosine(37)-N6)-dimethylallyltransferase MiaA n=1 Tax=Buchnera aphidicola TaxID=9 RepID=UPI00346489CB